MGLFRKKDRKIEEMNVSELKRRRNLIDRRIAEVQGTKQGKIFGDPLVCLED